MENELRPAFGIRTVLAQERWMYGNISFGTCLPTSQGNKVNAILQGLCLGDEAVGKQFDTLVAKCYESRASEHSEISEKPTKAEVDAHAFTLRVMEWV